MGNRAPDWLRQAEADLEHAQASLEHGDFEWSCFAAQQAAEKAIKAVFYHLHGDPWGHSLLALLEGLAEPLRASVTRELLDSARALDKQYIPTRYPNGFAQGATRGICLVEHLGQHDIHVITRPDEARHARLLVDLDRDGTAIRCQDAGEEAPISRAQYVL